MRRLASESVGANARSKTQTVLKDIFRWAKKEGYIYSDPTRDLEPITIPKPNNKHDFLSPEEIRRLLDPDALAVLEQKRMVRRATYYHPHVRFLVETGCRPGEMVAVRDSDLHLAEEGQSYVWVRHSRYGREIKDTKTAAGNRKIPLSDGLAEELLLHLSRRYEHRDSADQRIAERGGSVRPPANPLGFTFTSPWGRPLDLRQFRKVFKDMCIQAKIDTLGADDKAIAPHPYTLRRTFLTHLAESGAPQSAMMALAGHSDFRATQVYLGSTEDAQRQALTNLWTRLQLNDSAS
jgi:integrase